MHSVEQLSCMGATVVGESQGWVVLYLDVVPDVGDGEWAVLPDDVEDGARDGLRLLRRRRQLDPRHLRLPLLRHPPRRSREHLRRSVSVRTWPSTIPNL